MIVIYLASHLPSGFLKEFTTEKQWTTRDEKPLTRLSELKCLKQKFQFFIIFFQLLNSWQY